MAAALVKVKIEKDKIAFLGEVPQAEKLAALASLSIGEHVWTVGSIVEAKAMMDQHNKYIAPTAILIKPSSPAPVLMWNWEGVSSEDKKKIVRAYNEKDWLVVFELHNDLKLSEANYCCEKYRKHVDINIEQAYKEGII